MRWYGVLLLGACLWTIPTPTRADLFDDARRATRTDLSFQDSAGMTIRGGISMSTGQRPATVTLFRHNAQIGGACGSFDLGDTLKEAFEQVPALFQQAGIAVVSQLPILTMCFLEPTLCDAFKHYQALLNVLIQAKFAQCQNIQTAMAYGGLRLRGGETARCLEDEANAGHSLTAALATCNGNPTAVRRADGTPGVEANLVKDVLAAAGASTETATLARNLLGEVTLQAGNGPLRAFSQRPQTALLQQYERHKSAADTALREAVDELEQTGGLTPPTLQAIAVPGQAVPRAALDALVVLRRDPVRYETLLGKLATGMAITRLTWECHEVGDTLAAATEGNTHLSPEEKQRLEHLYAALVRELGHVLQKVEVVERHYQRTLDELQREYEAVQSTATQHGLRAPTQVTPVMPYRTQMPSGYSQ